MVVAVHVAPVNLPKNVAAAAAVAVTTVAAPAAAPVRVAVAR